MVDNTNAPAWGELINPNNPASGKYYPVHIFQERILQSRTRFIAAIAGTGGGKTVTGPLWIANRIHELRQKSDKPILGMVVAPTYKVLSRATVPTLVDTFKGTVLEGVYKESRSFYQLPKYKGDDGGLIWCQGADNPGGLEGGQFDFVWGDEAGQFKYSVWLAIQGRTGAKQSPVLFTTTPYGKNWLYHDFVKKFESGDPHYYVQNWSSNENPAYPDEEYERAKGSMSAELALMRYDGKFMGLSGLVFPEMPSCFVEMTKNETYRMIADYGTFYGGIDFGWNDPFCALCGFLDRSDVLWIWYERYKTKTAIEKHASALPKFAGRSVNWFADHSPEFIDKLRKGGHKVRKANKGIIEGINAVNSRIYTERLKVISNCCPAIVGEAEVYKYPDDEETSGGDKPIDMDNHSMDALRYLVMGVDRKRAA